MACVLTFPALDNFDEVCVGPCPHGQSCCFAGLGLVAVDPNNEQSYQARSLSVFPTEAHSLRWGSPITSDGYPVCKPICLQDWSLSLESEPGNVRTASTSVCDGVTLVIEA